MCCCSLPWEASRYITRRINGSVTTAANVNFLFHKAERTSLYSKSCIFYMLSSSFLHGFPGNRWAAQRLSPSLPEYFLQYPSRHSRRSGVEGSAFSGKDHLHCILMVKAFFAYTLACQCVIYVRYRNYLGGNGDLFAPSVHPIAFFHRSTHDAICRSDKQPSQAPSSWYTPRLFSMEAPIRVCFFISSNSFFGQSARFVQDLLVDSPPCRYHEGQMPL